MAAEPNIINLRHEMVVAAGVARKERDMDPDLWNKHLFMLAVVIGHELQHKGVSDGAPANVNGGSRFRNGDGEDEETVFGEGSWWWESRSFGGTMVGVLHSPDMLGFRYEFQIIGVYAEVTKAAAGTCHFAFPIEKLRNSSSVVLFGCGTLDIEYVGNPNRFQPIMSKRGLSWEEKKTKMLEIFHQDAEFFTIKELERIAPKQKGIVQQTVKEVVDELASDGLIQFDKIGTSNYFWSFPSAAGAVKQAAVTKSRRELEDVLSKIEETSESLEEANKGREDTAERRKLLSTLADVSSTNESLRSELAAFGAADPERYERKRRAVQVAKDAAVRWTGEYLSPCAP
ncbi:MAG: hypothetical protein TREMPRED_002532 [Tremellales sp. Tagirdzhanova-0007]|nr:MAG: hypothetical protein TREMPRED_002532 [Tremellales sp. Tagirdzhanova-0007]